MVSKRHEAVTLITLADELQEVVGTGQFNPARVRIAHETLNDIRDALENKKNPERVPLDGRTVDTARVHIWAAFVPEKGENVDEGDIE